VGARSLTLSILPGEFSIARLPPDGPVPACAEGPGAGFGAAPFCAVVRTAHELSVIVARGKVRDAARAEHGYRVICLGGPFDFGEVGVLASVLSPLAEAGVSVLTVATFDTDYVLVKESALGHAVEALRRAGHTVEGV
jgi:hypothetical protein